MSCPYYVMGESRPQLVVPYTLTNNDLKWGTANLATGEDFFAILREAFDLLYEEGREKPKMMNVGMHMRLLGPPGPSVGSCALPRLRVGQTGRLDLQARGHRPGTGLRNILARSPRDAPQNRAH